MRILWLRTWESAPVRSMPFLATAFLLGQAVLANVWLVLGLQAWLSQTVVLLVLLASMVAGLPFARRGIVRLPVKIWEEIGWWSNQGIALRLVLAASMVLLLLLGIGAFVRPPVGDAEAFYMAYPKIIAASERVTPMPTYWSFSQVGLIGEMHFAALMQLSGVQAAKLFVWPISLASAIMLMGVAAESGLGRIGQWFAVMILVTSTAFTNHITDGKVDLFAAALGIAAFYWALKVTGGAWRQSALAIAGLCTGFAVVAKLPYVVALLPSIFVLLVGREYLGEASTKQRSLMSLFSVAGQFGFWIIVAAIPHMIKNGLFFGAPFTPIIGPPELTTLTEQVWLPPETTGWVVLTYPFALVFSDYVGGGKISFLWLAFLFLTPLLPRAKPLLHSSLAQLTAVALVGTALWVFVKPSVLAPRYILATLLMFVPLAAGAAEHVYQIEDKRRWLGVAVVSLLIVALTIAIQGPVKKWPLSLMRYAGGKLSECELAKKYCPSLTRLNERASPGARVYFAGYYGFWLRPDLLQCRQTPTDERLLASSETTRKRWTTLFERGFRYVVIDKSTHQSALVAFDPSQVPDWMNNENIWDDSRMAIYEVKARKKQYAANVACRQISNPAWDVVELRGDPLRHVSQEMDGLLFHLAEET